MSKPNFAKFVPFARFAAFGSPQLKRLTEEADAEHLHDDLLSLVREAKANPGTVAASQLEEYQKQLAEVQGRLNS